MAFDKNIGGHAFPARGDTCLRCGMTWARFTDSGEPRCTGQKPESREPMAIDDDDKIYADASQAATLRHAGGSVDCLTLQEAVLEWMRLPEKDRNEATITVRNGPTYNAAQIDRLHNAKHS
jgi:hypothetical protein